MTDQKPSDGPEFKVPAAERDMERMIRELGADKFPRATADGIAAKIRDVLYSEFPGGLTVCVIWLKNGFAFVDHSAPVSPENYNKDIGRKIAYERAFKQIWSHEGYLLKEVLHQHSQLAAEPNSPAPADRDDPTDTQAQLGQRAHE